MALFETQEERRRRDQQERRQQIINETERLKPQTLARQDDQLRTFIAEHENDRSHYEFSCDCFGDFLALRIRRFQPALTPEERRWRRRFGDHYSGSLNLRQSRQIQLVPGRAPDRGGTARFCSNPLAAREPYAPPRAIIFVTPSADLRVAYTELNRKAGLHGPYYHIDEAPDPGCGEVQHYGNDVDTSLDGCARPACDDTIVFTGPDATLFVPFGLGETVYRAIQTALS